MTQRLQVPGVTFPSELPPEVRKELEHYTAVLGVTLGDISTRLLALEGGGTGGITELTGNVTAGPGTGSQAATIAADAVTYARMQNISAASMLLGRGSSGGSGDPQEIALGAGLSMSGTTLSTLGVPYIATLSLNNTQMVGMSTPIDIVAAPGANLLNVLVQFTMKTNLTTAYDQSSDIFIRYSGDTTNLNDQNSFTSVQTGGYVTHHIAKNIATASSVFVNKALQAYWNVSSGGNAANTGVIYAVYYTMAV